MSAPLDSFSRSQVCVVIPTYNEEELVERCVRSIRDAFEYEGKGSGGEGSIVVTDGGSRDGSVAAAKKAGAIVIETKPDDKRGRGPCLHRGAMGSPSECLVFVFLHVDCLMPKTFFKDLETYWYSCKASPQIGFCRIKFTREGFWMWLFEMLGRIDSVFSNFGDQGIIVSRDLYNRVGGFRSQVLLEDVQFFRDARPLVDKIHKFPITLSVSARKFDERGPLTYFIQCCVVLSLYVGLGWSPKRLAKLYNNPLFFKPGRTSVLVGVMILAMFVYYKAAKPRLHRLY
ncbi:hypothetical protein AAMO2058_000716600 [Amorphochlora amoebiformis]